MKKFLFHLIADMGMVLFSFLFVSKMYSGPIMPVLERYQGSFMAFLILFLIISFWFNKYEYDKSLSYTAMLKRYAKAMFYTTGIISIMMYFFQYTYFSRFMIFGTLTGIFVLEFMWISAYQAVRMAVLIPDPRDIEHERAIRESLRAEEPDLEVPYTPKGSARYREIILEEAGEKVLDFLDKNTNLDSSGTHITSTTTRFNIMSLPDCYFETIINLKPVNNIQFINKFLEAVNVKLKDDGLLVCTVETLDLRKKRILKKYLPLFNYLVYWMDVIINRVLPKMPITKKIYFSLTSGNKRILSHAEMLGRLSSCGFRILSEDHFNGMLWVISQRRQAPVFDYKPTYGPLIRLRRVGKEGKQITVYKLRTMHPYSEYLQEYIYKKNSLGIGGKFSNDFRVTGYGRFLRTFWLDELPMIYNLLVGDLKIVGVRPLSHHYFSLYDEDLQVKRIKTKPGLVPPYYAQYPTPASLEEVMANEHVYLDEYLKSPILTDIKYFFKAFYNIFFRKARSK
jgi:lipopolysaccharide/colanic/teichoic acid biosynthesis glycosyltransferase